MSRIESFPIDEEVIKSFNKTNQKFWNTTESNGKYIYINLSMVRMQTAWVIPKLLYAKGIQERTGAIPIAITWSENKLLSDFFASYGVMHISIDSLCKKNIFSGLYAAVKTMSMLFHKKVDFLKNIKMKGVVVGSSIYEDILRTSSLSTLHTCRSKVAIKKVFHLLWAYDALSDYMSSHIAEYAVMDDLAYHEEMLIKLFHSVGAKVVATNYNEETIIKYREDGSIIRRPQLANDKYHKLFGEDELVQKIENYVVAGMENEKIHMAIQWVDNYLNERFKGNNGRAIDRGAFADKAVYSKTELIDRYGLDKDKKTIVIMAHTFTDAVYNYGVNCFRDYYDWLERTLSIAENVKNVNWILKPHPTRSAYNESEDSIEDMFARHKQHNIFFMDDDVNSASVKDIADAIVTIGGNAGAEYACLGIPAIIMGKPYYAGFGYTYEPETYDAYCELLKNVDTMDRLEDKQIVTAKIVFYMHNSSAYVHDIKYHDEFANLVKSEYLKMTTELALQYFADNTNTKQYNTSITEKILEFFSRENVRETEYYQRGCEFSEEK